MIAVFILPSVHALKVVLWVLCNVGCACARQNWGSIAKSRHTSFTRWGSALFQCCRRSAADAVVELVAVKSSALRQDAFSAKKGGAICCLQQEKALQQKQRRTYLWYDRYSGTRLLAPLFIKGIRHWRNPSVHESHRTLYLESTRLQCVYSTKVFIHNTSQQ